MESSKMNSKLVHSIAGFLLGFVTSMVVEILFLSWPIQTLGLAAVIVLAFIVIVRRDDKPLQRGYLIAGWFTLGYGIFSALLAILDLVFPPLT
jgi:methionine salvage enolase-phosphatase E1